MISLETQAGVRYKIKNSHIQVEINLVGFKNILEACRNFDVEHFVYANPSSIYGMNAEMPFYKGQNVGHPLALNGATASDSHHIDDWVNFKPKTPIQVGVRDFVE